MWTLIMGGVLMDGTADVFDKIFALDNMFTVFVASLVMLVFILFSAVTIMNMLIGVLCEVVSTVAQTERDDAAIRLMKTSILRELRHYDTNQNGKISRDELDHVMKSPKTVDALEALDIDVECLRDLHQVLIKDAEVTIEGVMELLLSYRGDLPCTVKHVVESQVFTRWELSRQMKTLWNNIEKEVRECNLRILDLSQRLQAGYQCVQASEQRGICPSSSHTNGQVAHRVELEDVCPNLPVASENKLQTPRAKPASLARAKTAC